MTEAAINLIESKIRRLEKIKDSKNILEHLKKERKVNIKTVILEIILKQRKLNVEAMILNNSEICVLLGRQACREMGKKLQETPEISFELTRWDKHLTEATKKLLLREEEKEERRVPEKRKSTMSYIKYAKRAKTSSGKSIHNKSSNENYEKHFKD